MKDNTTWGLVRDGRTELVGRKEESRLLDEMLAVVETKREPRIVSIVGAAGIGKSRLVQEFVIRNRALRSSLVPRVYRGSARDTTASYGLFSRLFRARFGLTEGMPQEDAKQAVRAQVAQVLEDRKVGDVVYYLGQFLELPFEESPLTRALADDPQQAELVRRAVVKAFLEADAASSPVCLVFDELHLAHDDSLGLLRYLLEYLGGPILVLCMARPELLLRHDDWSRVAEARHTLLELPALRDADAVAMMHALLSPCEGGPPEELVDSACTFAAGNPLQLEQMVRIFHDTGVLEEADALAGSPVWRVSLDKLSSVKLPLTIEDAVNARLAALEPDERTILEQAAAMGSVFWSQAFLVLSRLDEEAPPLWSHDVESTERARIDRVLADLTERDYVLELPDSTFPGTAEYIFKHNKERETIAKRTPSHALREYHRAIAEWLDDQHVVHQNEEYVLMVAEHKERGGDLAGAGLGYLEAGDIARARYASSKASEHYERGLTLLAERHVARRIDALHNAGDVLQLLGRIDDALAAFREMLTLAYRLDKKSKGGAAHGRIGRLYREIGSLDEAHRHLHTALALFRAAGDERGVASTTDDIGKLHWLRGEYGDAIVSLRDGLTRRRRLADRRGIALSLNNIGLVLSDMGELKQALEVFEQSLQIRREIGDLPGVVSSLISLGTIAQDQLDFAGALALFEEAHEVARQVGDRNRIALVLTNIGELHYRASSPEKAIEILAQAESLCDELGDKLGLAEALRGLGKAHLLHGDLAKARDCIGRAVDLFAAVRSKVHLGVALRTLGEITAAGGWGSVHTKSAREYFARSVAIFEQTGNEVELARTFTAFARFLRTDPNFSTDASAADEATQMETRARATFGRLSGGLPRQPFKSVTGASATASGQHAPVVEDVRDTEVEEPRG